MSIEYVNISTCVYRGRVVTELPSKVAFTGCEKLSGTLQQGYKTLLLEYIPHKGYHLTDVTSQVNPHDPSAPSKRRRHKRQGSGFFTGLHRPDVRELDEEEWEGYVPDSTWKIRHKSKGKKKKTIKGLTV